MPEPKVTFAPLDRTWTFPGDPEARRLVTEADLRAIEETIHRFEEAASRAVAALDITPLRESGTATDFFLDWFDRVILGSLRQQGHAAVVVGEHRPRLDKAVFHDPRHVTGMDTSPAAGKLTVAVASCHRGVTYYVDPQTRQPVREPAEGAMTAGWSLHKMDDGTWKVGRIGAYSRQGCVPPFFPPVDENKTRGPIRIVDYGRPDSPPAQGAPGTPPTPDCRSREGQVPTVGKLWVYNACHGTRLVGDSNGLVWSCDTVQGPEREWARQSLPPDLFDALVEACARQ